MEIVISVKDEIELWIKEAYDKLLQGFQDKLTKEEQAIFLWNAHVLLSSMLQKRNQSC